jgi:hypothetical protein
MPRRVTETMLMTKRILIAATLASMVAMTGAAQKTTPAKTTAKAPAASSAPAPSDRPPEQTKVSKDLKVKIAAPPAGAGGLAVVYDPARGAMLRWILPSADQRLPKSFRVERNIGGEKKVIGEATPGLVSAGLNADQQKALERYLALEREPDRETNPEKKKTFQQGSFGAQLITAASPAAAAFMGLAIDDPTAPRGATAVYTVFAASGAGERMYAASPPTKLDPLPPPDPPAGFRAELQRNKVGLFWNDNDPASRNPAAPVTFEIRRRTPEGKSELLTPEPILKLGDTGKTPAPGFVDENPLLEVKVPYTITSLDLFGRRGPESSPVETFMPDFGALDPPTHIVETSGGGRTAVTWEGKPNSHRAGWKVMRALNPEAVGEPLTTEPLKTTTISDTTGTPGTAYYYQIFAVNQRGETSLPGISKGVVFKSGKTPSAPSKLSAERKTGRILLSWTPPAEAVAGYQVERSIEGKDWTILNSNATSEPRYEDGYSQDATGTFSYRVVSWSYEDNKSAPSEAISVPLADTNPPMVPIVNGIDGADGKVVLHFSPRGGSDDAAGFYVLRSRVVMEPGQVVNTTMLKSDSTELTDRDVEAGSTYFYRVVAVDAAGNRSEPTNPVSVQVSEPALVAPPSPRAHFETKPFPRVIFDFDAAKGSSIRWALERKEKDGKWSQIQGPFPAGTTTVMDAHPPGTARAIYRLVTIATNGAVGPKSPEVEVPLK